MRWSLVLCLLLASVVLARPRPKRSLGYIKSLITTKLFGSTKFVIVRPMLAKNETHQLFKIPGFDDILIKVSRNEIKKPNKDGEKDKVEPAMPVDLAIVKPEVAIIGSYLGTETQKETLLAIEMAKSLLKSGIITGGRDNSIQELIVPIIPEPPHLEFDEEQSVSKQPLKVIAEEQGHVFVPLRVGSMPVYSEYPPLSVSPELNHSPLQSKYFYKQKGPNADMTYESHDNKDVIVTRTEKEPPLPQFLKFRIADVANIGTNPFVVRRPLRINGAPGTYPYYINPNTIRESAQGLEALPYLSHRIAKPNRGGAEPEYIGNTVHEAPISVDRNSVLFSEPLSIDVAGSHYFGNQYRHVIRCKQKNVGKVCPHDQNEVKTNNDQHTASNVPSSESKPLQEIVINKQNEAIKDNNDINVNRVAVNEFLKNHSVNGQLVSQYLYKQMNHHSRENYTEVKLGSSQKEDILVESGKNLHKDFVFIPPEEANLPPLNVLSLNNEVRTSNSGNNDKTVFTSKVKSNGGNQKHFVTFTLKSKEEHPFNQRPIVVSEQNNYEEGEKHSNTENAKTNESAEAKEFNIDEYTKRGDIPGSTF